MIARVTGRVDDLEGVVADSDGVAVVDSSGAAGMVAVGVQIGVEAVQHAVEFADVIAVLVGEHDPVQRIDVVVYNDGAFDDCSFGRTDRRGQSRERLIESLERILDRLPDSVSAIYAGHGDPFHSDPGGDSVRTVIERALDRAERREPKYPDE